MGKLLIFLIATLSCLFVGSMTYATPLGMPASAIYPHGTKNVTGRGPNAYPHNHQSYNNNHHQNDYNHNNGYYNGYHNDYYNRHYYNNYPAAAYPFAYAVINDDSEDEVSSAPVYNQAPPPSNQASQGMWINASNGNVPNHAISYGDENSNPPTYHCRAVYNAQLYYGELIPGDGCYVEDQTNNATIRLKSYQALVGS